MPLDRPTRAALAARIAADLEDEWDGASASEPDMAALVESETDLAHGAYGYAEEVLNDLVPSSASLAGLQRWGRVLALPQKPASAAAGSVSGEGNPGATLSVGALLVSAAGGVYEAAADAVADGDGDVALTVRATSLGTEANLGAGATLTLVSPTYGIGDAFTVEAPGIVGADEEGVEAYRARVIDVFRNPPQGGALHDYRRWALQVPGVARAWALPADVVGLGAVAVYIVTAESDPTPTDALIEQVAAFIATRARGGATVTVSAPAIQEVDVLVFVNGIDEADEAAVEDRIDASTAAVFAEAPAALDPMPALDYGVPDVGVRFYRSRVQAAAGDAAGVTINVSSPGADVAPATTGLTVFVRGDFSVVFT